MIRMYSDKPYKKFCSYRRGRYCQISPSWGFISYDAMVRMVQDFSYRYPLVDGHETGPIDGDGARALY